MEKRERGAGENAPLRRSWWEKEGNPPDQGKLLRDFAHDVSFACVDVLQVFEAFFGDIVSDHAITRWYCT
jgi:hypothetical protein